ncbi:ABC transporter ATP-binding protein [Lacrimispora indolis]|uniref:ABC transporter ATP-binding protein n=1 Tax=Lacrimispora indolis TaxID=69825 RepID=UPI00041B358C|nr:MULTISPECIES: ABC transporter ATP-binding protein [Lachnospiraceae]
MILQAEKINKRFMRKNGGSNFFYAVQDMSLSLNSGQLIALFGRSGSGKSTLLNILSGLLKPSNGCVKLDDDELYSMDDSRLSQYRNEHFGVIPQGQAALQSLSVLDNVLLPCTLFRAADTGEEERAMALLEETGIGNLRDVRPSDLSGGEMRRMAIARALIRNPDVILADEPTADLDDENTEIVLKLLRNMADQGKIVFVATHDKDTFGYADSIYRMDAGIIKKERWI